MSFQAKNPYREIEQTKAPDPECGELVYRPQGRTDRFAGGNLGFRTFVPAALVGLVVGWAWTETVGVINIGMGAYAPSVASATDTNRITLEASRRPPCALTQDFYGHAETTEWFGKVRVFLRSVGWTPLPERGDGG